MSLEQQFGHATYTIASPYAGVMREPEIKAFNEQANLHHPTIEFTAEKFHTDCVFRHVFSRIQRHKIQGKIYA